MMMTNDRETDRLDAAFAAARASGPAPSGELLARILRDADAVLRETRPARPHPRPSWWHMVFDAVGGWPSIGGLAAAAVAGVWIGVAPPAALVDFTALLSSETIELPLWDVDVSMGLEG